MDNKVISVPFLEEQSENRGLILHINKIIVNTNTNKINMHHQLTILGTGEFLVNQVWLETHLTPEVGFGEHKL